MKKQIYGAILFVAIVSFSVFIYEYLNYSERPDCSASGDSTCVSQALPYAVIEDAPVEFTASNVMVKLSYVAASMKSQTVKARLNLEWEGAGERPKALWVQLEFHNFDGSSAGWLSEPLKISEPFKNGDQKTIETSFDCLRCVKLSRNLYASATVRTSPNVERKLVYEINGMKSVLVQE